VGAYIMVIDAFLFYNEFELLELRLEEMGPVVDYFLIQESPFTFTGNKKDLVLADKNKWPEFMKKWGDKIRVVSTPLDRLPCENPWEEEAFQRNYLEVNLENEFRLSIDSGVNKIIVSDVDEILRRSTITNPLESKIAWAILDTYYYGINLKGGDNDWPAPFIYYHHVKPEGTFDALRRKRFQGPHIHFAGWHYSYVMSPKKIINKINSFSHTEYRNDYYMDLNRIETLVEEGKDLFDRGVTYIKIPVDSTFPKCVRENPEKWKHLMR